MGQQKPQQETVQQHSADYAPYPTPVTEQDYPDATTGVPVGQTWGTQVTGTPDQPSSNNSARGYGPGQPGYVPSPGVSGDYSSVSGSGSNLQSAPGSGANHQGSAYVNNPNPQGKDSFAKISSAFKDMAQQGGKTASNISKYFSSGNNVANTVVGRTSHGFNLLSAGGKFNVFRNTFGAATNEELLKTYVCHLSTSTGPVAGTLYISNLKLAFCSDRPLTYSPTPGQQAVSHYKVVLPLEKVKSVNPSANQDKPEERYIQLEMLDSHEFWFMGFINYDKALMNLRENLARNRPQQGPPAQGYQSPSGQGYQQFDGNSQHSAQYPPQQQMQGGSGSYPPQQLPQGGSGSYPLQQGSQQLSH
eukprot:TRINITY_DN732_c0_g1_i2.p1 TRINITY_DN732_c0_g1~~TRINITY_DN732_c0_g1_i2.p1  ORF type:complete len:360 (-),score=36.62 TRINITY_DN732_c0_g1_i2:232-1311(-)